MFKKKLYRQELIGSMIQICTSTNVSLVGVTGVICNETRNTVLVKTKQGVRRILKHDLVSCCVGSSATLSARQLLKRPEERIKG